MRDSDERRRTLGDPDGLSIRATRLFDPHDVAKPLDGIRAVFIAMGSIGIKGVLQSIAINAAARTPSIEQVTRISVLNTSAESLRINQRAHSSVDQFAASTAVPYSTILSRRLSVVAADRSLRSAGLTDVDGSGRERPRGIDRPPRRGRVRTSY